MDISSDGAAQARTAGVRRGLGVSGPMATRILGLIGATLVTGGAACTPEFTGTSGNRKIVWHVPGRGWNSPAVDAQTVYFGSATHELVAIDRESGIVRWRATTQAPTSDTRGTNIVLAQDVVVMGDWYLHAFARETGAPRWRFAPEDHALPGAFALATDGATIYAGSPEGRVFAIDASTGAERWSAAIPADAPTAAYNPAVAGDLLIVGYRTFAMPVVGGLVAFSASTGTIRWHLSFEPSVAGQYSGSNGGVFAAGDDVFVASAEDGRVFGIDPQSGSIRWTAPRVHQLPSESSGGGWSDVRMLSASADGRVVVAGSSTGIVVALDPVTGAELWRASAGRGSVVFKAAIGDSAVFVNHMFGQLAAFDRASGTVRWMAGDGASGGTFFEAPVVAGDRIYLSGFNGFYALSTR